MCLVPKFSPAWGNSLIFMAPTNRRSIKKKSPVISYKKPTLFDKHLLIIDSCDDTKMKYRGSIDN